MADDRQFCQECGHDGRWLEHSSQDARVDYYRCHEGHVWSVPKNNHKANQTPVTLQAPAVFKVRNP